jgi:DNA (cytosine-5)-methyltransferase 1
MLLPTPTAGNFNDGESLPSWQARKDRELAKGRNGNGIGTPLGIAVQLLPTPKASDGEKGGPNQRGSSGDLTLPSAVMPLLPRSWRGGTTNPQ